jgi:SET domain-containing protein
MLLVPTYLKQSPVHGIGCFAAAPIAKGTLIWRHEPALDIVVPEATVAALPDPARQLIHRYAYRTPQIPGGWVLPFDNTRFINHDPAPNTDNLTVDTFAARDIAADEEITADYGEFTPDTDFV